MRGYRRLIFAGLLLVLSYVGLWCGKLTGDEIISLWQWLGLAYLGSDGVEKAAEAWKGRGDAGD